MKRPENSRSLRSSLSYFELNLFSASINSCVTLVLEPKNN